jgi:PAS domain S-box-containing protein
VSDLPDEAERLRLFISSVADYAIYMLSPTGDVVSWNLGAQRFKGYEPEEIIGKHFSTFYTEEDRANGVPARALEIARTTGKFEAEGWRVRKDGSRFWANVVLDPIRDANGELIGFTKITRDITERKEAAEQLEKAREALFQSQKLEAIGMLTGGIAHDFNNLLNVLTNGLSMLRQQTKDADSLRLIDSMEKSSARGSALTRQLLSFARKQPLRPEARDVGRLVTAFETVLRRANRSAVRFEVHARPRMPAIMVDATQFETALLNLVVNARDATPDGGLITISAGVRDLAANEVGRLAAGQYIEISVTDSGTGMAADVASRAIEPFFTTKAPGKGTGLGLSQVYGLTQQSGGDLKIDSTPGQGTTVSMFFPTLAADQQPIDIRSSDSETVLVVDDQPEVLAMVAEIFRTLGFEVLTAGDGRSALNVLTREPHIDLLFSDIVMPGMNGIQLASEVKDRFPEMKILLASGYPPPEAGDLNQFDFLAKPFTMAEIARKLRTLAR